MNIWDAFRGFSGSVKKRRGRPSGSRNKRREVAGSLRGRDLRMEQFEERMLLSISTPAWLSNHTYMSDDVVSAVQRVSDMDSYRADDLASVTQWVVGLESASCAALKADSLGASYMSEAPYLENMSIWEFPGEQNWQTVVDTLDSAEGVDFFYPLVPREIERMMMPDDTLFNDQWHLLNTGQDGGTPGADANVVPAWDLVLGTGVVLAIVDDGLQYDHPDLASNYRAEWSWDYGQDDNDPYPVWSSIWQSDDHGTAVAGVAGATGNNGLGVSGSAPDVDLVGIRIDFAGTWTSAMEALVLTHEYENVDIYNNSWSMTACYLPEGPLVPAALENAITNGRDGLGNIYVFSGGNSRLGDGNVNQLANQNSRYTIAVAAIDENGQYSYYSNPGAALLISAYSNGNDSGITTTDRTGEDGYNSTGEGDDDTLEDIDYTSTFGGTSSSAPLVSGIVALILEANPDLTYRDVQSILVNTAKMTDPSNADWATNGAGHYINHNYGFGAVDAAAAVNAALTWENLSEEVSSESGLIPVAAQIPDGGAVGMVSSATLDNSVTDIEYVEVTVDIDHWYPGDLEVILTSPDGTESVLANSSDQWWNYFYGNLENWTFTSTRHWGESSEGEWTLQVRDKITYSTGTWNSWSIKAYGENIGGTPGPGPEPEPVVGPELISVLPNSGVAISDGDLLHTGPRELKFVFNEGQVIDEATLSAIRLLRAGGDDVLDNANDVVVDYGWIGLGERPNEVVVRFAETLPDDLYRITLVGAGETPLMNVDGTPFHQGEDVSITFDLDLGALVTAIVPQPTWRDAAGDLHQDRDKVVVYFNSDTLDEASAENANFYRLTITGQTADPADDVEVAPQTVEYNPVANTVVLTFADDLADYGAGAFHLRIGNEYREIDTNTRNATAVGDTYATATDLGMLGSATTAASLIVSSGIEALPFDLEWPGAITDVGHRDLPKNEMVEAHYLDRYSAKDVEYGTATLFYNFQDIYGADPSGNLLHNLISEAQKDRTREIMELYGYYMGLQTVETAADGMTIVTGDLRALDPFITTGPGGVLGLASKTEELAIMDAAEDWNDSLYGDPGVAEEWEDGDGMSWFLTAMHEIGHLLGIGHSYDLEPMTVMGEGDDPLYYAATSELVYPGDHDIVHGQHIFRPDNTDVDVYQFTVEQAGVFSAETVAERMDDPSLLDSQLKLYEMPLVAGSIPLVAGDASGDGKVNETDALILADNWQITGATREQGDFNGDGIVNDIDATIMISNWLYEVPLVAGDAGNLIAANDDYYSEDSYLEVYLQPGTYYVAVSSTGNDQYDLDVEGSGIGGTTQGEYDLRVSFTPDVDEHISDATGTRLDGDADGTPGGVHNFWFNVQSEDDTIFVDKVADGTVQDGSLANPYKEIDAALAASAPGDIVRIVGNYDREYMAQSEYDNGPLSHGLAVGDLDGDGWDDIVSTTKNELDDTSFVSIFFSVGDGTFWAPESIEVGVNPTVVELGDITGDGLLDILVANGGENTISRLRNLGNGTFETMPNLLVGQGPSALALGDLNGDGDLDIVAANSTDDTVSVLLSNGQGGYLDQAVHDVGASPSGLALGDFDNNQRIDIAVANSEDDTINILLNEEAVRTKATQFTVQTPVAVGDNPMSLAAGDLTGDGTVDVVVVNTGDDNISVLSGMGDGNFAAAVNYAAGGAPSAVKIAKLDNNATLDVVVSNSADDTVSVFFTKADESLESPVQYGVGDAPDYLALSDVDNDGVIDIMTANTADDTISVLLDHRDVAYEIGYDIIDQTLSDGRKFEVPQGVTVMIDAGAVFKLRKANIDVGSSTQGVDRSEGALQVLGTPDLSVFFTSYHNKLLGVDNSQFDVPASGGDWGGLVMRNKLDYEHNEAAAAGEQRAILEEEGIFLNYVNHADITYGGGQVVVNSNGEIYNPLHMEESRPTLAYNVLTKNADAAMSADPNSFADTKFQSDTFTADYDRVGPEIHGNYIVDNSINGIFVRVNTNAGKAMDELEVCARWDDIDIVHVVSENLVISGTPGGLVQGDSYNLVARQDARLAIDPGIIVKLDATRIEAEMGSQLIAEGNDSLPVVFTSLNDDRHGMGGTFDSSNNAAETPAAPGDWGGIHFGPVSSGSIGDALFAYGGGSTPIEGRFADFNTIEIHQAKVRIAESVFEYNTSNASGDDFRNGRNTATDALIFVRGAQPIIVGNTIWNNDAPAISINANSIQADQLIDWGRSRGETEAYDTYQDNHGPLVAENRLSNNELNGMLVRGATLTTSSVWDDTDIVHILRDEIVIPNHHTYSGLRLQSNTDESLVVKLLGTNAGFTALGTPQEIDDRVGGTLQIIGMPGFPVVLTSLSDDAFGAGHDPWGNLQTNTDNANRAPVAGSWNSVKLERYVNDRNVAVVNEMEPASGIEDGVNDEPASAQELGSLAWNELSGDDNLRLGFDINGFISSDDSAGDDSADVDVYSFKAEAGVEVWLDIDRTTLGLDSVIELVDANGAVFARSDNSEAERLGAEDPYGLARIMDRDVWYINDQYTTNPHDAGMRVVLPGPTGLTRTYYVRVSSADGDSIGAYQLQVRLQEKQEFSGSYINMSSIHYATNGIEMLGLPTHSPLVGTSAEMDLGEDANGSFEGAEYIGNLLYSDQAALQVSGTISGPEDIDWYSFDVDLEKTQSDSGIQWPTMFDIDYADGMARADLAIWVYDIDGTMIYSSEGSNIDDDRPGPEAGADTDDLDRGSLGPFDPFIGTALLPVGNSPCETGACPFTLARYYVAVTTKAMVPTALDQPLARIEPVTSIRRAAEDHVINPSNPDAMGEYIIPGSPTSVLFDPFALDVSVEDYDLNDVVLYVCIGGDLYTVDPFTGELETDVTGPLLTQVLPDAMAGTSYGDIAMRSDGQLYTFVSEVGVPGNWDAMMRYRQISTENDNGGAPLYEQQTGINTFMLEGVDTVVEMEEGSIHFQAMAHSESVFPRFVYAVGNSDGGGNFTQNLLYKFDADGTAIQMPGAGEDERLPTDIIPLASLDAGGANITGMAFMGGTLYAVDDGGGFHTVNNYDAYDFGIPNPDDDPKQLVQTGMGASLSLITNIAGASFSGLALGPQNVEDNAYSEMLFATTTNGMMYALDAAGDLQPVFLNGETSIQLGGTASPIAGTTGLAFSTLDYNLWHVTENRKDDAGHGVEISPDDTRLPPGDDTYRHAGESSFWFGLEQTDFSVDQFKTGAGATVSVPGAGGQDVGTYNLPGGAHGTLTTDEFSLAGCEGLDIPTLYFTYFLETDGNEGQVTDSARVYISHDGAEWTMLASNILTPDELLLEYNPYPEMPDLNIVNLRDGTGGWRQAKVELTNYVNGIVSSMGEGSADEALGSLRLKFEFATAGSMNIGEIAGDRLLEGGYLRAVAGEEIIDGDQFEMTDLRTDVATIFEFDMGFSLVVANSAGLAIDDGDTFTIDGAVFELTKDQGYGAGNNPVFISDGDSAANVAALIGQEVASVLGGTVTPYLKDDRVYLTGAAEAETTSAGLDLQGNAPGLLSDQTVPTDPTSFVPVPITPDMTATEVAEQLGLVIDATLAADDVLDYYQVVKVDEDLLQMVGHGVTIEGPPSADPLSYSLFLPGDAPAGSYIDAERTQFNWHRRGEDNSYEGFYIDDVIIGYAERGEMMTDMQPDTGFRAVPEDIWRTDIVGGPYIMEGPYHLEIRTGTDYTGTDFVPQYPFRSFDTNDRMTDAINIKASAAHDLVHGSTFTVNDGVYAQAFQFVDPSLGGAAAGAIGISFSSGESAPAMATKIAAAINSASLLQTKAESNMGGDIVFLADAASVDGISITTYGLTDQPPADENLIHLNGDDNEERDQGQIIIEGNEITDVIGWGIIYDSGARDGGIANLPHPGSVLPLVEVSEQRLVPGVMIENNLMAFCQIGGILFSGDANTGDVPTAAVPFGRIVNNTIYGGALGIEGLTGIGIKVEENASPTILNNIIANTLVGISVDGTSQTTVIGATAYQNNDTNVSGTSFGQYDIILTRDQPLFVDPSADNFYLAAGSPVIDSSLDSLEDRPALIAVRDPLGIPESPILAPEKDLLGQSRADDLTVAPPLGMGKNIFKDRGAFDRLDFIGPAASVINPLDNDAGGLDRNSAENDVFIIQGDFTEFVIQLADVAGVGIADSTVTESALTMYIDDRDGPLVEGRDYFFSYDVNTDQISLVSAMGIWESAHEYTIELDNSATGIRDIADNPLRGNRLDKTAVFNIAVGHIDYGDAPDPAYRTLLENDGARHLLIGDYYLGEGVTSEADAQFALDEDEIPLWNASGDQMDDGVVFGSALVINGEVSLTVTASRNGGYLDAWIDFNNDGDWNDIGERIFTSQLLGEGENQLEITIPSEVVDDDGIDNTVSKCLTFARFRYSSDDGGLEIFGEASDGEVEDYQVHVVDALRDYGDAPGPYPTLWNDDDNLSGAYHILSTGGLHLGDTVDDELDGQPNATATGDDIDNEIDDEDGVNANNWFVPGEESTITVMASDAGYLNAWIDFNRDGDWDDAGEQIAAGTLLAAGDDNVLNVSVPGAAIEGVTYARFRFSSEEILGPTGPAMDGEVEDYRFLISSMPYDFGDAPLSYPTMDESGAATLAVQQQGSNNDFLLTAATAGTNFNDIEVVVVNEAANGDEALVVFSVVERRLTIDVDPEATTANTAKEAINTEGTFVATLLSTDDTDNDGTGLVATLGNFGETSGGFDGVGDDAAQHELGHGLYLGSVVDAEIDGQAGPLADGDDEHDLDDEDGVVFGDLVTGQEGTITVTAAYDATFTGTGYLNAWIDFNQDGNWTADEVVVSGQPLGAGENELAITIPGDAEEGMTIARFRFSTQADLSFEGLAPDGEVEDYQIEILRGDASISGYKFDDRDNDSVWDMNEPGIVGVTVFVDLNENGILDTDSFGNPTEPFAVTMEDDLSTLGTDETGLYEFRGLMGRQDPYIVREIPEAGWIQTYPNATVNLPDGSFGNDDGSYSIYLNEAEEVSGVDFGNFRLPVMFIDDIKVAEGDAGYTDLEVTVHQQGSFGDTVSVHYWTEDGTAVEALSGDPSSNDYQLADGVLTFPARTAPEKPWEQEILTKGFTNESVFHTSGDYVVWQARDSETDDWEIYLFDGTYDANDDPNITQLTDNDTDDTAPFVVQTDTGANVVWVHRDKVGEVLADTEIYLYDGTQTTILTDNDYDDRDPQASDSHVTWWAVESMGLDSEIFLYEIDSGDPLTNTINLSDNNEDDFSPQISGEMVVWTGVRSYAPEIMLYDGTEIEGQPRVEQLTAYTSFANTEPQIDGNTVVWQRNLGGNNYEIYMYEVDPGGPIGIPTRLTNNSVPDRYPQVSGNDIVWEAEDGSYVNDLEIMHYNTISQADPVQITNNDTFDQRPQISGTQVVWQGFDIANWEVFTYELRGEDGVQNVSQNSESDWYPQVTDSMIVWRKSGDEDALIIARAGVPEVTKTVQLRVIGDENIEPDENFFLHIEAASSESEMIITDDTAEITILNDDGALDYGDAAAPFYPTLVADDGARHLLGSGVYLCDATQVGGYDLDLGAPDSEEDGLPSENADGDNLLTSDDEKGVMFAGSIVPGGTMELVVVASVDSTLDAWIDFNRDGDWGDTWGSDREHMLDSYALIAGENVIGVPVPAGAALGQTYARFRVTSDDYTGDVNYTGYIDNGEVEDYRVEIVSPAPPATSASYAMAGSDGDDTIEFIAGDVLQLIVNGDLREYSAGTVGEIVLDAGLGHDTVILRGSENDETVELWADQGVFQGDGYTVRITGTESITAIGGGGKDHAVLNDSAADDIAIVSPTYAKLYDLDETFYCEANGFEHVRVVAGAGGYDTATLLDSVGNDTLITGPTYAKMFGDGFCYLMESFERVTARSDAGGTDIAQMWDSTGDDTFVATPTLATMRGDGFYVKAERFDEITGYGNAGGFDKATLRGSAGNDAFVVTTAYGKLSGQDFTSRAYGFEEVDASGQGGEDEAVLYDSIHGDYLEAAGDWVSLSNQQLDFSFLARSFNRVEANSSSAGDRKDVEDGIDFLFAKGLWEDI